MNGILRFQSRKNLTAKQNLKAFLSHAREVCLFQKIDWPEHIWDISDTIESKRLRNGSFAYFRSARDPLDQPSVIADPMKEPFCSFAKAAFSEIVRIKRPVEYRRFIYALQAIEQALIDLNKQTCITQVTDDVLNESADILKKRFQDPWHAGRTLEWIIREIINPAGVTPWPLLWRSPFPYLAPTRNDRVYASLRTQKLPEVQTILDLADIHQRSLDVRDRITTSFVSLAMFAPSRVSEILSLPVDCITRAQHDQTVLMGLRWKPVKGGSPITKFAPSTSFAEVASEAIHFLIKTGEKARQAAAWYEKNPDKLYLPDGFEYLRECDSITLWEFSRIIGKATPPEASHAFRRYGLERVGQTPQKLRFPVSDKANWAGLYSFKSAENWVLGQLPESFPIMRKESGITWSNALFVLPKNILRPDGETLDYIPEPTSISQITHQLGANPGGKTVFSRHGKVDADGQPRKISTHQFRHLLNTLAQSKYLNQSLIAFWSGRKNINQNAWYEHLPQEAFIEAYRKLNNQVPALPVAGPLKKKASSLASKNAITYDDALRSELGAIHVTRFGICRHDYALTPCPRDKDCINCGEHLFVKGEQRHLDEARVQLELHEKAVGQAHKAVEQSIGGAQRWLALNEPKLARWKQAVTLLTDPDTPNGTLISMPAPASSQTRTGLAHKMAQTKEHIAVEEID